MGAIDRLDLRGCLRTVGDQGPRGTCVSFAVTAIHECHTTPTSASLSSFSEEVLFWGAKQVDGDQVDGTRFSSASNALGQWGQPSQELWPYDPTRDHRDSSYTPPPEAIDPANCHLSALRRTPHDVASIRAELEIGRPVAIAFRVWGAFLRAESEPLPAPSVSDLLPTRHAVVVVGHDYHQSAVLVRNSWGDSWGQAGYLWVSDQILDLVMDAWVIDEVNSEPEDPKEKHNDEAV